MVFQKKGGKVASNARQSFNQSSNKMGVRIVWCKEGVRIVWVHPSYCLQATDDHGEQEIIRTMSCRYYTRLPDAIVEKGTAYAKIMESHRDDHSICMDTFENGKKSTRRPFLNWKNNNTSKTAFWIDDVNFKI